MLFGKALCEGIFLGIDDEVDVTLAIERHLFRTVPGDRAETHPAEQLVQYLRDRDG